MASALEYRPAIDGLRAIAVISVFVFHLNEAWLPGGFVGVDVFFVISGYLISSIILVDCGQQKFSLRRFYQRRIARIFPLFFLVAVVTMVGAWVTYSTQDFASAGAHLAFSSLSIVNIKYMLQSNYFEISRDAQPFLHYWSLSVEEQFYMLYPIVLFLLRKHVRRIAAQHILIYVLALTSFVFCVVLTRINSSWAFYLLPTRGWELLAGCILAIRAVDQPSRLSDRTRSMMAAAGLALLILCFAFIRGGGDIDFPGFIALAPVLGTCLIIANKPLSTSTVERLLSSRPATAIGRLSYSLYLWHWPVFALTNYALYESTELTRLSIKISVAVAASVVTHRFIERPVREFLNERRRQALAFAFFALAIAVSAPVGIMVRQYYFLNAEPGSVSRGGICVNDRLTGRSIMLIGDSNGTMYGTMLRDVARTLPCRVNIMSVAAGNPLPSVSGDHPKLWLDSIEAANRLKPDVIVYVLNWSNKLANDPAALTIALKQLETAANQVVLITQPPELPIGASREGFRHGARPPFFEEASARESRIKANQFVMSQQSDRVHVIDIESIFVKPGGEIRVIAPDGRWLYQDRNHLSGLGADLVRDRVLQLMAQPH